MNKIKLEMSNAEIFGFWSVFKNCFENESQYLPAKVSFYFYKNLTNLNLALEAIEKARQNILNTYGNYNEENNTFHFPNGKKDIANKELSDLLSIKQEVEITLIPLSWLENLQFTSKQMQLFGLMIEED